MRSTIAGRAPATTSGTFVWTCATAASAPAVAARAAVRTGTRRTDMVLSDIEDAPRLPRKGIRSGRKDEETTVLALLGFLTVATLFVLIVSRLASPLVALIAVPIAAALAGGFGLATAKFIVAGLQQIAPVAAMFVFAILFFVL